MSRIKAGAEVYRKMSTGGGGRYPLRCSDTVANWVTEIDPTKDRDLKDQGAGE
jgi:hypothetical protein